MTIDNMRSAGPRCKDLDHESDIDKFDFDILQLRDTRAAEDVNSAA